MTITVIPLLSETGTFTALGSTDYYAISGSFTPTSLDSMINVMVGFVVPDCLDEFYSGVIEYGSMNNRNITSDGNVTIEIPSLSGSTIYETRTYMASTQSLDEQKFEFMISGAIPSNYVLSIFEIVPTVGKYISWDGVLTSADGYYQEEVTETTIRSFLENFTTENRINYGVMCSALHTENNVSGSTTISIHDNLGITSASALWSTAYTVGSGEISLDFELVNAGFSSGLDYSFTETDNQYFTKDYPNVVNLLLDTTGVTPGNPITEPLTITDENSAIIAISRHYNSLGQIYTDVFELSIGGSSLSNIQQLSIEIGDGSGDPTGLLNIKGMGNRHEVGTFDAVWQITGSVSQTDSTSLHIFEIIPRIGYQFNDGGYIRSSYTEQRYDTRDSLGANGDGQEWDTIIGSQVTNEHSSPLSAVFLSSDNSVRMLYTNQDGYTSQAIFSQKLTSPATVPYIAERQDFTGAVISATLYETQNGSPSASLSPSASESPSASLSPSASASASPSPSVAPIVSDTLGKASWYYQNKILDKLFGQTDFEAPDTWYLALSSTQPTEDGSNVTEPSGGGYSRISEPNLPWHFGYNTFPRRANYYLSRNYYSYDFPVATSDWGNVSYLCFYDAPTNGNLWFWCPIGEREVLTNDKVLLTPGHVQMSTLNSLYQILPGGFGTYFSDEKVLDKVFGKTDFTSPSSWWIALSNIGSQVIPEDFTEVSGSGYGRLEIPNIPSNFVMEGGNDEGAHDGDLTNRNEYAFGVSEEDWGVVRSIGFFDSEEGGNMWYSIVLSNGGWNITTRRRLVFLSRLIHITNNNRNL